MLTFHRSWAFAVVVLNIAVGIWGLVLAVRGREAPRRFPIAILAGQAALALQVIVGVALSRRVEPPGRHVFYGYMLLFVAVLSWTVRGEKPRRALAVSSGVALFLGIVAIRTIFTA